jgi:CO/xanthine dehydrogenase Mo-binding subunit
LGRNCCPISIGRPSQIFSKCRVQAAFIENDVGGGFGIRGELYRRFSDSFATVNLGQPIKWIEDRREHLMARIIAGKPLRLK